MIPSIRNILALVALVVLTACAAKPTSKFKTYNGPPVTQIVVEKGDRQMFLLSGRKVLKAYDIGLGFQPIGHKQFEGDGRTPEGLYYIDRRNPDSRYHLSIGISYPNPTDAAYAASLGQRAGSDIFIHGQGPEGKALSRIKRDWTAGCIAVTDAEAEDIYAMVQDGTPIQINP